MLDTCQIILWSITYVLIIVDSIREKARPGIPIIAVLLNFSWEIAAVMKASLVKEVIWGNVLWLVLDAVIWLQMLNCLQVFSKRIVILFTCVRAIILFFLFDIVEVQLISSYVCDLVMAAAFLVALLRNHIRYSLFSVLIGVTKCLGDLFAWLFYKSFNSFVFITGAIVLQFNMLYVALLVLRYNDNKERGEGKGYVS